MEKGDLQLAKEVPECFYKDLKMTVSKRIKLHFETAITQYKTTLMGNKDPCK
jgi:hypothetical protein